MDQILEEIKHLVRIKNRSDDRSPNLCSTPINFRNMDKLKEGPVGHEKVYLLMTQHGEINLVYNNNMPHYSTIKTPVKLLRLKFAQLHACSWASEYRIDEQINIIYDKDSTPPPYYNDEDDVNYLEDIIGRSEEMDQEVNEQDFVNDDQKDLFEISSTDKTHEKYNIISTEKGEDIINKSWELTLQRPNAAPRIVSYAEGIFFCGDAYFEFPLIFNTEFEKVLYMVRDYITHFYDVTGNMNKYNKTTKIIEYIQGESLICCPYFIAYTLFLTADIRSVDDVDNYVVLSVPEKHIHPLISLKNITAEQVYGYFRLCSKVISIDNSCEYLNFWNCGELRSIFSQNNLNPKREKLMVETYKQIQELREEAIQHDLRGGIRRRRRRKNKKTMRKKRKNNRKKKSMRRKRKS